MSPNFLEDFDVGYGLLDIQVELGNKRRISSSNEDINILLNKERMLVLKLKNYQSESCIQNMGKLR